MKTYLNRRELLIGAGAGAIGTVAAVGVAPVTVFAAEENDRVEGSWYVTVHITKPSGIADFDATYGFARGGVFTRIDGRTNAPAVGTWKAAEDGGIVFSNLLFNFAGGVVPTPATRSGAIVGNFAARVIHGKLIGTFTADGTLGLTGFHREGTFTGTRIAAVGPQV
jgi:hypothetical protein